MDQTGDRRREHRVSHFWRTHFQARAMSVDLENRARLSASLGKMKTLQGAANEGAAAKSSPSRESAGEPTPQPLGNSLPKRPVLLPPKPATQVFLTSL